MRSRGMYLLWLIVVFILSMCPSVPVPVPDIRESQPCSPCTCHQLTDNMVFADCSNLTLTEIPEDLPVETVCLDLSDNHITLANAPGKPFAYLQNLSVLSLSGNRIESISRISFYGLDRLKKLDLSLNRIRYRNIAEDAFDLISDLEYLDIKQDVVHVTAADSHSVNALSKLTKLRTLMIDIANTAFLGDEFRNLTSLEELYMSGTYGYCNVPILGKSFFANLNLTSGRGNKFHLYMSNCEVDNIENGTFAPLINLTTLDLSWNQNLTFRPLLNVTAELGASHAQSIRYLNLNSVYQYYLLNKCTHIQTAFLAPLYNTTLQLLSLESNNIINWEIGAVEKVPKQLKYLSVRDNMLLLGKYTYYVLEHNALRNLLYYDTATMFKSHIPPKPNDQPSPKPQRKRKSFNCLDKSLDTGVHLDIQPCCNTILKRFSEYDFVRIILSRVEQLQNGTNSAENKSSLKHDYRHRLPARNSPNTDNLLYLDVSENLPGTVNFSIDVFRDLTQLLYLNISMNMEGYPYFSQENASLFQRTQQLKVLDLRFNRIRSIWPKAFRPLNVLEKLYLSSNKLVSLDFELDNMKKLSYLDLSGNYIKTITTAYRNIFNSLPNIYIDLSNNMLKCSCKEDPDFVKWMLSESSVNFVDYSNYECVYDNKTNAFFKDINLSNFHNDCFPPKYLLLIVATSFALTIFVIVLTARMIARYKWNFIYFYYMTKYRTYAGYMPIRDKETEFDKDIFVSYADEDSAFVRRRVIQELQDKRGLSLMIHEHDFEAGQYVADNIMKAVSTTRRTLALLSKDYIRSKWCTYELNMARLQGIDTGKEILCVVLLEDIPDKYLQLEIIDIIKRKTYIDYPREPGNRSQFWERLGETLKR